MFEAAAAPYEASKAFYKTITELGDSRLYLVPSALLVGLLLWLQPRFGISRTAVGLRWLRWALLYLFAAVALSGITANLIKFLVGRSRPRTAGLDGVWSFEPLNFASTSFPSGHASTVFAVAAVLGILIPLLRWPLLAVAAGLALTRVVVRAHFLSDVIAGAAIGIATAWWLRAAFARRGWAFVWTGGQPRLRPGARALAAPLRELIGRRSASRQRRDRGREAARDGQPLARSSR
jgi:undecaprenyl-diphosphatase